MTTDTTTQTPTDDTAAAAQPHLDMNAEQLFPGDSEASTDIANLFGAKEPDDGPREQWIYRVTNELRKEEVARLFQVAPHLITARILKAVDQLFGESQAKLLGMAIPGVDQTYRAPVAKSAVRRLAMRLADRYLDMIPRGELAFAQKQYASQLEARLARAKVEVVAEMALKMRKLVVEIEGRIFPGPTSALREGKSFRGERVVAVWAGVDEVTGQPTKPTCEPEF